MFAAKVLSQRKPALQKTRGRKNGIGRDRRKDQSSFFLGQMDFAARLEPEFPAEALGNQNLPLWGELGYGHGFFLLRRESVPRPKDVGKRKD